MQSKKGVTSSYEFTSTCPGCKKNFKGTYGDCSNYYSWSLEGHFEGELKFGLTIKCPESGKIYNGYYDMLASSDIIKLSEMDSNLFGFN